ncbi:MAG: hypothetical protein R3Y23_04560 [Bacillota bacterium]
MAVTAHNQHTNNGAEISQIEQERLFAAIVNDDATTFKSIVNTPELLALSFGRFPLLSLCYLYDSNNIIVKNESDLLGISEYIVVPEIYDISRKMRATSPKSLRLYQQNGAIVSPLEMAVIIGDSYTFKSIFNKANPTSDIKERINSICFMQNHTVVNANDAVFSLPKKGMNSKQALVAIILLIAIFVLMCGTGGVAYASYYMSRGTEENPISISSEQQLIDCINGNYMYIELHNDITLSSEIAFTSYSGTIYGNDKTIYLNNGSTYIFDSFKGELTDINIVIDIDESEVSDDYSPFIINNYGTLKNVTTSINWTFTADGEKLSTGENDTIFVGGLVANNFGTIDTCEASVAVEAHGTTNIDTYFGGVVGYNENTITGVTTLSDSTIVTDTIDAAGIVGQNYYNCTVSNSINYASVTQTSVSSTWTPNVAGIVIANYGNIEDCENYGTLTANGNTASGESSPSIYIGGISAVNGGYIYMSKNDASISAVSGNSYIYAGGIVGVSLSSSSAIENTASFGEYYVESSSSTAYVFLGGSVGWNIGYMYYSFSCANLSGSGTNLYIGGLVGINDYSTYNYNQMGFNTYYYSNIYLNDIANSDDEVFGIASLLSNSTLYPITGNGYGFDGYDTVDEIKQTDVYWE